MVLALDGSTSANNSTNTISPTLVTAVANDIIIVAVSTVSATSYKTVSSITSTPTLTWTKRTSKTLLSTVYYNVEEWYATWSSSGSLAIVITLSGTPTVIGVGTAFGISGANTSTIFDSNASLPKTGSGTSTTPSVTISTSNANDFIFGIVGEQNQIPSVGSGYTQIVLVASEGTEYKVVSSTQSNLAVNFTITLSRAWVMIADAIIQASAPPAGGVLAQVM